MVAVESTLAHNSLYERRGRLLSLPAANSAFGRAKVVAAIVGETQAHRNRGWHGGCKVTAEWWILYLTFG